jgi:hypothetical protein
MLPAAVVATGLIAAFVWRGGPSNTTRVRAALDGREYQVQDLPDKQEAAERMAALRKNLIKLRDHYKMEEGLMADPPIRRFVERFNPDDMVENDLGSDSTS